MKGFKSTSTNPYTYTQQGVWKKGQYTFQAVVLSDSGYAFAFQRSDTTWQTVDLSWQVKDGSYSKIQWTFTLEEDAVAFRLIANTVTGETIVVQPMLEKGTNGSTPIAHEEDLRGMDGDNHEFIFTRNDTGIAPPTPLSTQEDDYTPIDDSVEPPVIWTDNPQGVTKDLPYEFVSMREKKNGVWLDFSPPSLWAKWSEDGLSVNLLVEGHYKSHWEGTTKVVEIVGGVDVGGKEVVKVSAVFRKGEENIAATVSQSRGFQWYVNGVHLTDFDNQPFITLDETYGDGFADYVVLSYLVNSIREEERREIINISEGMDGIGEEFIFIAHDSEVVPPELPQPTDEGYQEDDYHGHWSDDPVAPTEVDQFVWVAKRKKVGGIWEPFGEPSVWTRWVEDGEDAKSLILSASSLTMKCNPDNTPQTGQTISIEAKLQNVSGTATFVATPYNDAGTALTAITLGGSGNTRTLTNAQWLTTYKRIEVVATLGSLSDTVTITRVSDGGDGADGHSPYIDETTNTWWVWDDTNGLYKDTGHSPVGSDGVIPYPAGYYDNTKWYRREAEYAPYVQYGGTLYLLIKDTPNAGIPTTNTEYWKAFNNWQAVFVDSLVAAFAKIGGAVFTGDTSEVASGIRGRMISEMGEDGTTTFTDYTGDDGSWQPNIMLDFRTGKAKFANADIVGHITATSGSIGGVAIENETLSVATPTTNGILSSADKAYIEQLKDLFEYDADNDAIKALKTLYSTGGVSAYGLGSGGSSGGGGVDRLDSWANYTSEKANYYVPASLLVPFRSDTLSRLDSLESGSATSIVTTGSGNAITSVSKSGNTLTFAKGSTFSLSTHNHDILYKPIGYVPSWSEITGKPSAFTPSSHTHTIAQVTGLQGALDLKAPLANPTFTGNVTAPTFTGALTGNASSATKLQTARTIAGVSFNGTANINIPFANLSSKPTTLAGYGITDAVTLNTAQTITGAKTFSALLTASAGVNTPKVDFGNGFTVEPSGTELVFKYNGVIKQRMLSNGTILATGGVTALATS